MSSDFPMSWEQAVEWLRQQPGQQELVRACFYDDPLTAAAERFRNSTEWRATREHIPRELGRALDVGAGRGIASYALTRDGWDVTALEPDPSTIVGVDAIRRLATETGVSIRTVEQRGEHLPFADKSFDLVYARQALHHAADLKTLCAEIGRVLKRGGTFIAVREHVISRPADIEAFRRSHPLHRLYGGERAYLLREYRQAIRGAGIDLEHVLNPMMSDINLFPSTRGEVRELLARKMRLPSGEWIPDMAMHLLGAVLRTPGRLYSFVGRKRKT